ncbi:hypothetical protein [Lentzea kentuckyensis]|uniref:hypothetical protein n=1 Tax=Lentzea kentuckyensis TaxID=360086 RepID=UPI000A3AE842|nr:hypothetical protein [Lentzea kentuckyensis]
MSALVWLTWRQHRWAIIGVAIVAVLATGALLSTQNGPVGGMLMAGFYGLIGQLAFGAVIGVFWGAPLIARELEERTYFVAWGQDVTPVKWLRGKVLLLGGLAMALGALLGIGDGFGGRRESWGAFEASPLVQAGYALFGFALGVFIGLLSRHVVTAMAATLVFYTAVRTVIAVTLRDHYLPAHRDIAGWDATPVVPAGALELGGGYVGADLNPVAVIERCAGRINEGTCMRAAKAATGLYTDYQPLGLMWLFQVIEFLVFVLLAAVLLVLTFRVLRRGGGWKPSRRHRRIDPDPVDAAPVDPAPVDVEPGGVESGEAEPADAESGGAKSADAKPGGSEPGDAKSADAKLGGVEPGDAKSVDAEPGDAKPADAKPADAKSADAKPGDAKSADAKPGDAEPSQSASATAAAHAEG